MSAFYRDEEDLFAAIEAYADAMGEHYGHERVGEDAADELINSAAEMSNSGYVDDEGPYVPDDDDGDDAGYPIPLLGQAAFAPRLSLPAPPVMSPGALYTRLLRELKFPECTSMLSFLDRSNADAFSCMPSNLPMYEDLRLLSQKPEDVIEAADESERNRPRTFATAVDLNAHGKMELPRVPDRAEDLPGYVQAVQEFFMSELEAREAAYLKLFLGYCSALARYIRRSAAHETKGLRVVDREAQIRARTRRGLVTRYYREAARMAKAVYLHLYLSVCRELARRLAATQAKKRHLFVKLKYEWPGERQFRCIFQPLMQNHGVSTIDGEPLTATKLKNMNHFRVTLGLPPVRSALLESAGESITQPEEFSPSEPRSSWYLTQKIKDKLEAYSKKHGKSKPSASVSKDHPYAKNADAPNYGSTPESMLDYPDPARELPCDPYLLPCVTVEN